MQQPRCTAGGPFRQEPRILRSRRYRLAPTPEQQARLVGWSGALRSLWNAALEQRRLAWRMCGVTLDYVEQSRDLTAARAAISWLADVPAQAAQQTLRDLDHAFSRYFRGLARHPRFRTRRRDPGIRFPQGVAIRQVNGRWGEVRLTKLGWIRFRWTRALGGRVRFATVSRDTLGWHLSLCVESELRPAKSNGGPAVGVDRGVAALVATSDGVLVTHDFWSKQERRRRLALEKRLARQRRGSRRRARTVVALGSLRARVARRRRDALHKISRHLATGYGLVAIEALNVRAMTRSARGTRATPGTNVRAKAGLNREILECGWGELRRQLIYKSAWYGATLIEVDARYTSQTCAGCQSVDPTSRESQARFRCRACGRIEHADINAARVILARAIDRTAGGPSVAARGGLAAGRPVKREPPLRATA
jgi:putative transposase